MVVPNMLCDDDCELIVENERLERLLEAHDIPVEDPTPVPVWLCPALAEMLGFPARYPLPPALSNGHKG